MAGPSNDTVPNHTPNEDATVNNAMPNLNPSLLGDLSLDPLLISEECWDFLNEPDVVGTNGETMNETEPNLGNYEVLNNPSIDPSTVENLAVSIPESGEIRNEIDASQDLYTVVWNAYNESAMGYCSHQSVPSNFNEEMSNLRQMNMGSEAVNDPNIQNPVMNSQVGSSSEILHSEKTSHFQREMNNAGGLPSVWPAEPVLSHDFTLDCKMLKEITHRKGFIVMNLELHGNFTLGLYSHAINHVHDESTGLTSSQQFDFSYNNEEAKKFVSQYYIQRKTEGYVLMEDPRSEFYEILSMNGHDHNSIEKTSSAEHNSAGCIGIDEAATFNSNTKEKTPLNLSAQRQRVKSITMDEISQFFHLPRREAAKMLGLSETVVTKIMHRHDPKRRWPYRKVKSLKKGISELKSRLNSDDNLRERFSARNEIRRKEEEMVELYRTE